LSVAASAAPPHARANKTNNFVNLINRPPVTLPALPSRPIVAEYLTAQSRENIRDDRADTQRERRLHRSRVHGAPQLCKGDTTSASAEESNVESKVCGAALRGIKAIFTGLWRRNPSTGPQSAWQMFPNRRRRKHAEDYRIGVAAKIMHGLNRHPFDDDAQARTRPFTAILQLEAASPAHNPSCAAALRNGRTS